MNKIILAALALVAAAGSAFAGPTTFERGDLMQSYYIGR